MAFGMHWEWRGFGAISSRFASRFCALDPQREAHYIEDVYLWIPGLNVNVKLREGAEEGLKFKRRLQANGCLELWFEDPLDVFAFPLDEEAWTQLRRTTRTAEFELPPYSAKAWGRRQVLDTLEAHGCKLVPVQKWREGKHWQGQHGPVIVEWTCIHGPQVITSISVESAPIGQDQAGQDSFKARADLEAAIKELVLDDEPLITMNYMTAVATWTTGQQIEPIR